MWGGRQAGDARWCPPHPFSSCQMLVPTHVGQVYAYDSPKGEQDEYYFPCYLLSTGSQEIYDVLPVQGGGSEPVQPGGEAGWGGREMLCHSVGYKSGQMTPKAGHIVSPGAVLGTSVLPSGPWEEAGTHTIPDSWSCVRPVLPLPGL